MMEKNIEESIVLGLFNLTTQLKKIDEEVYQKVGLTSQQGLILLHLSNNPNLPFLKKKKHKKALMASELAESLNVSRANISNLINVLLEKSLILQYADEEDRRKKRLKLTEKGFTLLEKIQPARMALISYIIKDFNLKEKETFLQFLEATMAKISH